MADGIPWSDPDGTRTPSARDTALMAAWRTFTAQPRPGNTHDWLWAAIVHGHDTGVAEVDGRLAAHDAQKDARIAGLVELYEAAEVATGDLIERVNDLTAQLAAAEIRNSIPFEDCYTVLGPANEG